jgi:hypothetical protein
MTVEIDANQYVTDYDIKQDVYTLLNNQNNWKGN